jgi:hypothetical protein
MTTITPFLKSEPFDQCDIDAMSMALNDVCNALEINGDATLREIVAIRIIELTRRGERNSTKLRDRLLDEANGASRC